MLPGLGVLFPGEPRSGVGVPWDPDFPAWKACSLSPEHGILLGMVLFFKLEKGSAVCVAILPGKGVPFSVGLFKVLFGSPFLGGARARVNRGIPVFPLSVPIQKVFPQDATRFLSGGACR